MSNINRDYMVVVDVKTSTVSAPTMYFYNTDVGTSNIYVQLVVKETIINATPIENASDYVIKLSIIKGVDIVKELTGVLVNEEEAIYEFNLPADCTDLVGNCTGEFEISCTVGDHMEVITTFPISYEIKASILTGLDPSIQDSDDLPILKQLINEVRGMLAFNANGELVVTINGVTKVFTPKS